MRRVRIGDTGDGKRSMKIRTKWQIRLTTEARTRADETRGCREGGRNSLESAFFVPPNSKCNRFNNQFKNSPGSPRASNRNLPLLARLTSCKNSCGETWALNNFRFHTFLARLANLFTSSGTFSPSRFFESKRKFRRGGTWRRVWIMTLRWSLCLMLFRPM